MRHAVEGVREAKAAAAEMIRLEVDKEASCSSCEKRQRWFNAFGRKLGIGKKSAEIAKLLKLEAGETLPVLACAVHGKCVPSKSLEGIEGAPHSCQGCQEKELVAIASLPAPPGE